MMVVVVVVVVVVVMMMMMMRMMMMMMMMMHTCIKMFNDHIAIQSPWEVESPICLPDTDVRWSGVSRLFK
jgi:hypothetical protein